MTSRADIHYVEAVNQACGSILSEFRASLPDLDADFARFIAPAQTLLHGGKRTRARLAYTTWCAALGDRSDSAIVHAGAALELFQVAALIHDDVIDDADTRRGAPASHRQFERVHVEGDFIGSASTFGHSGAILLGDLLLALSQKSMGKAIAAAPRDAGAMEVFNLMCAEVAMGQFLDIEAAAQGQRHEDALARALLVVRHKSARYSVEHPLVLGAALAGASREILQSLSGIGTPLGEAFQLRDDDLGVFGDPAVTGKPAGDDLAEGKLTPLILLGLQLATPADAAFIRGALGDRSISAATVSRVRSILTDSGAVDQHEALLTERYRTAIELIEGAPLPQWARRELTELATSLTRREH